MPAVSKPKNAKSGGFTYSYYEGDWDTMPDFKSLKPVKSGTVTKDFDINKLPADKHFAVLLEGFLEIEDEGYYLFGLDSDDGSRLYLGNQLLIDYNGLHKTGKIQSYIVPLKKVFYPFKLEYLQKDDERNLQLIYVQPNDPSQTPMPIPLERQYSIK